MKSIFYRLKNKTKEWRIYRFNQRAVREEHNWSDCDVLLSRNCTRPLIKVGNNITSASALKWKIQEFLVRKNFYTNDTIIEEKSTWWSKIGIGSRKKVTKLLTSLPKSGCEEKENVEKSSREPVVFQEAKIRCSPRISNWALKRCYFFRRHGGASAPRNCWRSVTVARRFS